MSTGIQPGKTTAKNLYLQFTIFQELLIHGSNFQFTTSRGFDVFGNIYHLIRIEIKANNSIVALRFFGFLFYTETVALFIKLCYAIAFRVMHPISKYGSFIILISIYYCIAKKSGKSSAIEDIVTKNKACRVVSYELFTNDESLGKAVWGRLLRIFKMNPIIRTIAQQTFESREVVRGTNDEDISNPSQHQSADRIVYHRFIIYRK